MVLNFRKGIESNKHNDVCDLLSNIYSMNRVSYKGNGSIRGNRYADLENDVMFIEVETVIGLSKLKVKKKFWLNKSKKFILVLILPDRIEDVADEILFVDKNNKIIKLKDAIKD